MTFGELFNLVHECNGRLSCGDDFIATLDDLGIWDAEVVEFEVRKADEDEYLYWSQIGGDSWLGEDVLLRLGGPKAERIGQRACLIVLPKEEG